MKKLVSLALVVSLICVLAVPVSAAEDNSVWIELLEYSSITSYGENWFSFTGNTASFTIPVQSEKRLAKIDMLVWHQTAERITAASVSKGSSTSSLTCLYIGPNISRVYGTIPNSYYDEITVSITKSQNSSATFGLLSCKVSPLTTTDFRCDAEFFIKEDGAYVECPGEYDYGGDGSVSTNDIQFPIIIYDWQKYDYITVTGSVLRVGLNSVRATIGEKGLPYEMTYTSTNPTGEYVIRNYRYSADLDYGGEDYTITGSETGVSQTYYSGKVLYNLTVDLSGVDRSSTTPLFIYFTGVSNGEYGYRVQVVGCTGSVCLADTSDLSWWQRFTSFMKGLFDSEEGQESIDDLDQGSASISQGTSDIGSFEQSQQSVLDNNFATIQNAVTFTNFAAALVFVQRYVNMTFDGISKYAIIFTLPLFLGLFFYLCSRIPGITRWKTPPPRSKGGGSP